jgi:hypothetical protein
MSHSLFDQILRSRSALVVDCAEGTERQMLRAKLKVGKVRKIFVTHLHSGCIIPISRRSRPDLGVATHISRSLYGHRTLDEVRLLYEICCAT